MNRPKCETCNGSGQLCRCRGCGDHFRHTHKYSDCGNARCEGEESDDVPCHNCNGTGLQVADPREQLLDVEDRMTALARHLIRPARGPMGVPLTDGAGI